MPRRDRITLDGFTDYGLNVFDTVGSRGANMPGDVMTIQAMFRYLYELYAKGDYPGKKEIWGFYDLQITGIADSKTLAAIRRYQRVHWYRVLSTDGVIHPAKYENRNINTANGKPLMTITLLHHDLWIAEETALDYTREIAKRFPNVAFWIQ